MYFVSFSFIIFYLDIQPAPPTVLFYVDVALQNIVLILCLLLKMQGAIAAEIFRHGILSLLTDIV